MFNLTYKDEQDLYYYVTEGRYLKYGDGITRDGKLQRLVAAAQWMLSGLGYDIGPAGIDGKFGRATEAAVKAFQADHGLAVDGIIGPKTVHALVWHYVRKGRPYPKAATVYRAEKVPVPLPVAPQFPWKFLLLAGVGAVLIALLWTKKKESEKKK